jgi:hypothetical protein
MRESRQLHRERTALRARSAAAAAARTLEPFFEGLTLDK